MAEPNYMFVYNCLKKSIESGEYPIDSLIPPEPVLEKMFHVSRVTVRQAVAMLENDGMVKKQRGIGTVVLNYEITQNLNHITSLTETLTRKGYNVTVPEANIVKVEADAKLAGIFGVKEKTPLAKITRIIHASETPLGIVVNYIPYELVEGIEEYDGKLFSLYKLLEEKYYLSIEMAQDKIYAKNANAEEAEKLQIDEGFALICVRRRCISYNRCISYDDVCLRHDMYGFDISLYGRK